MKKVFPFIIFVLVLMSSAIAVKSISGQRVTIDQDVNDNLMVVGQDVSISHNVKGDVSCAGAMVIIDGSVQDDINCIAGTISINNAVGDNVNVFGGTVDINARISGDLVVAGGTVRIHESAVIGKDLIIRGGTVQYFGTTVRNVDIKADNVIYTGITGKNVFVSGRSITFDKGIIDGDLTYASNGNVDTSKVTVKGKVYKQVLPTKVSSYRASIVARVLMFLALFVLGSLLILILPRYTKIVSKTVQSKFWPSVGIGLLALVLAPIAVIIFLITIIGIPLALVLLTTYILLIYTSKLAIAYWLGSKAGSNNPWIFVLTSGIALLIMYAFISIPVVGWIINTVLIIIGTGAMSIAGYELVRAIRRPRQ